MKKFILYIFLVLIGLSCQRPNTTIHGRIYDECSKAPLGNESVELWTGEKGTNRSEKVETQTTWPDGSFYFHVHASFLDNNYWVQCVGTSSDYIKKRTDKQVFLLKSDQSAISYLDLKVRNITPFDSNDSIFIDAVRPNSSLPTYHLQFHFKGFSIDTLRRITVNGCPPKIVNLNWTVTKNNITTSFSNSTVCTNGAVSEFLINY
ncbi:MAG: hypothetical protein K0Q95_2668 [Bacteroidota bacterium]|jgi:hypothetical protein|nr:hypothetical protein [Bacteroidota bacterium]